MAVLVAKEAPDFIAAAVVDGNKFDNEFKLSSFRGKKYVVLFFYPLDFTFVCPTELHAFQEQLKEFEARNTVVVGVSVDSKHTHLAWLNTPKNQGGIQGITYPVVSDLSKKIAADYDVLKGGELAFRATFIIDKNGIVQSEQVNNNDLGRNVNETLRLIDALQFSEEHGEVCPANWTKGDKAMKPNRDGVQAYFNNK